MDSIIWHVPLRIEPALVLGKLLPSRQLSWDWENRKRKLIEVVYLLLGFLLVVY